jgi:hypothetical protein
MGSKEINIVCYADDIALYGPTMIINNRNTLPVYNMYFFTGTERY